MGGPGLRGGVAVLTAGVVLAFVGACDDSSGGSGSSPAGGRQSSSGGSASGEGEKGGSGAKYASGEALCAALTSTLVKSAAGFVPRTYFPDGAPGGILSCSAGGPQGSDVLVTVEAFGASSEAQHYESRAELGKPVTGVGEKATAATDNLPVLYVLNKGNLYSFEYHQPHGGGISVDSPEQVIDVEKKVALGII